MLSFFSFSHQSRRLQPYIPSLFPIESSTHTTHETDLPPLIGEPNSFPVGTSCSCLYPVNQPS